MSATAALTSGPASVHRRSAPLARHAMVVAVAGVHVVAAWAFLQVDSVRQAAARMAPLMVALIEPAPPQVPPPPRHATSARPAQPPLRDLATEPLPAPLPLAVASIAPLAALAPQGAEVPAAPPAALAAPAPPHAPSPRTIAATAVRYLDPPAPAYPAASRRLGESGSVAVRVEIDTQGRPRQVLLARSSGFRRLDEAALAAVRAARFKPYTENGSPQVVWTTVPIDFELES